MPSRRTNNFPECGRGLGHVTPTIFGIRSNMSLKLLELETSNLIHGFVWAMPSRRTNEFPWNWAWPRSHGPTIFGSTVGYILATAWLLVKTGRHNSVLLGTPTKISGLPRNSKFIGDINRVGIVGVGWGVEPPSPVHVYRRSFLSENRLFQFLGKISNI